MRCLVTGVAGFLGSHLAERLLAEGHDVYGIDAFIDTYARTIKERNLEGPRAFRAFTFLETKLLEGNITPLLDGMQWIFHLAAHAGVRTSWGPAFSRYVNANILVTQRLLEAARAEKAIQRFVYASSSSVYGAQPTVPHTEILVPRPLSPYGVSKLAGEHLSQVYYQAFGLPMVALRYFSIYGPRQRPDMAFHRFCQSILSGQPLTIYGDLSQARDYTYVADAVEATLCACTYEAALGEAIDISGGIPISLHEVALHLEEISGKPVSFIFTPPSQGDVEYTAGDLQKAQRLLRYRPTIPLREGLAHEFVAIRANDNKTEHSSPAFGVP